MTKHSKQFLCQLLAEQVREPLFDWHEQLPFADEIIARVGAPVKNTSKDQRLNRPTNLAPHRESIAKLLAEVQETYLVTLDDFEARNDPHRPERKPRKKDIARFAPPAGPIADANSKAMKAYDCTQFLEDRHETWEEFWDDVYALEVGNSGKSRRSGPPVKPLYPTYDAVRRWWQRQELGAFSPLFNSCAKYGYDEAKFNAPLRFLVGVIETLDPSYTIQNVRSVCEKRRKDLKSSKKVA